MINHPAPQDEIPRIENLITINMYGVPCYLSFERVGGICYVLVI